MSRTASASDRTGAPRKRSSAKNATLVDIVDVAAQPEAAHGSEAALGSEAAHSNTPGPGSASDGQNPFLANIMSHLTTGVDMQAFSDNLASLVADRIAKRIAPADLADKLAEEHCAEITKRFTAAVTLDRWARDTPGA